MKTFLEYIRIIASNKYFWPVLIILLAVPAFMINLDIEPIIDDEGIRGLVTLEMKIRHNLITPTLGGEFYFNKPPLYNWILLLFSNIIGGFTDFSLRFPTVFFLALFALSIFIMARKYTSNRVAFYAALMLLTCGRILFFDSYKGLIDTCFSWIIFLMFYAVWHFSEIKQYRKMFIISYSLTAAAFLMKGLPAIVFLGLTLLVYLTYNKKFKELFSLNHLLGMICFILLTGMYYAAYFHDNPDYFAKLFETIVNESTKKSVIGMGFWFGALHLVTFPFEFIYYFLPWTFMVLYLLSSCAWKSIRANRFLMFCCITFAGNIIVYWISPDTFARYLFMFLPLVFIVFSQLHLENESKNSFSFRFIRILFFIIFCILLIGSILPPFLKRTENMPYVIPKTIFLFVTLLIIVILYIKKVSFQIELIVLFLLVSRIGFDWFVMTDRYNESPGEIRKHEISKIVEITKNSTLYYDSHINMPLLLNLTRQKMGILKLDNIYKSQSFYIISDTSKIKSIPYEKLSYLHSDRNQPVYMFVKFK